LVDLRVFRHRNFAIGCLLIGLFGAAIYGLDHAVAALSIRN
jgi:hypothetical protein